METGKIKVSFSATMMYCSLHSMRKGMRRARGGCSALSKLKLTDFNKNPQFSTGKSIKWKPHAILGWKLI
jgi:hypothetical protein